MWAGFYQKHVTHVREHLIYYNFSFLTKQSFLKLIKFITQSYLSLSNSILLLVLSIFSVFLKSLNDYFWLACLQVPVSINYNMWSSNLFSTSSSFLRFLRSKFFRVGPGFLGSSCFRVQIFLNKGLGSGSRFYK